MQQILSINAAMTYKMLTEESQCWTSRDFFEYWSRKPSWSSAGSITRRLDIRISVRHGIVTLDHPSNSLYLAPYDSLQEHFKDWEHSTEQRRAEKVFWNAQYSFCILYCCPRNLLSIHKSIYKNMSCSVFLPRAKMCFF